MKEDAKKKHTNYIFAYSKQSIDTRCTQNEVERIHRLYGKIFFKGALK